MEVRSSVTVNTRGPYPRSSGSNPGSANIKGGEMQIKLWVKKSRLYADKDEVDNALASDCESGELVFFRRKPICFNLKEPYYIVKIGRLVKPQH